MSWRKMTIHDKVWQFKFGKQNAVIRYPESDKKVTVSYTKLTGSSEAEIDENTMVQPKHIKKYIVENLNA